MPGHRGTSPRTHGTCAGNRVPPPTAAALSFQRLRSSLSHHTTGGANRLPPFVIFTTTEDSADLFGQFDGPFRSRCKSIPFTNQGLAPAFARRAREIADAEGLNGKPDSAYVRLVQRCRNNMRAVLQEIEAGEMLDD